MPTLVQLLQDTVNTQPEAEAIVFKDRRISYKELWADVCSIARYLGKEGLKNGDRVGIYVENSPEYIAIYYGVLAAGGVVVSLNTAAKARDILNWLNHCEASWLFSDTHQSELSSITGSVDSGMHLVMVGDIKTIYPEDKYTYLQDIYRGSDDCSEVADPAVDPAGQAAAIIYTSGTTGRPKGVTLSHRNLVSNVNSILGYLELTNSDRTMNILPFYYSYGNSVLHTHLASGACLLLENSMVYPHKIIKKMETEKVTGFAGVPSTYALLMNRVRFENYDLSSVRYMTQAGGAMASAHVSRFTDTLPDIKFYVMYGQTEATARITYLPPEKLKDKLGSVGIPIPDVEVEIQDSNGNKVEAGMTGELCVKGENVMLGYWNDKEKTSEVMQNGWLKTGDLAQCDDDGYISIVGRSTDMIKTGAHRISPQEIEEVILELNDVEEVAVLGKPDEILGQIIKAIIVPKKGKELNVKNIKAHCHKNLASYKIPKEIEFMDKLPKTATGKVQKFLI